MSLPSFAPFPPAKVLNQLLPEELEASLETWSLLARGYLLLPQATFSQKVADEPSLTDFLLSYMHENAAMNDEKSSSTLVGKSLKSAVFLLTHRTFMDTTYVPSNLLDVSFLEDLSMIYSSHSRLPELFTKAWGYESIEDVSSSVIKRKASLIRALDEGKTNNPSEAEDVLGRTVTILKASYKYGQFLMVGSDFLDALDSACLQSDIKIQKKIAITAYWCFISLMHPEKPKVAILIDHLYGLESNTAKNSLLRMLCSTTPFVRKFGRSLSGREAARAQTLLEKISMFDSTGNQKPKRLFKRRVNGKKRSSNEHLHWMTKITQVQDVLPDPDANLISHLLDQYEGDVEQVTAHLLENPDSIHAQKSVPTLPTDKSLLSQDPSTYNASKASTGRRTIFDDDEFSRLAISPSQLQRGRKNNDTKTADDLLADHGSKSDKAAILSALAAFDADDDERDDTYDAEDVGGTVDSSLPGTSDDVMDAKGLKHNVHEETLWQTWKTSPGLFGRDPITRRGQARVALRRDTGMTDEAIEGWGIMLQRDPRKMKRLETMFSAAGSVQQRALSRTAWQDSPTASGTETGEEGDTDGDLGAAARGGRGGFRGRGRGRGRGGRGGDVAGPVDDRGTQMARQTKDANKGSRANHNRRDQRARKLARGGLAG